MALDVAAHRLHNFQRAVHNRFRPAPQAGAVACLFRFVRLKKKFHVLALRTASRTRWPAVHSSGGDGKYKIAIVTGITSLDRLPVRDLIFLAVTLLGWRHFVNFREIKYRIACHNAESIRQHSSADHPVLAVKGNISGRLPPLSSHLDHSFRIIDLLLPCLGGCIQSVPVLVDDAKTCSILWCTVFTASVACIIILRS